ERSAQQCGLGAFQCVSPGCLLPDIAVWAAGFLQGDACAGHGAIALCGPVDRDGPAGPAVLQPPDPLYLGGRIDRTGWLVLFVHGDLSASRREKGEPGRFAPFSYDRHTGVLPGPAPAGGGGPYLPADV